MIERTFNYLRKNGAVPCPAGQRKKDVFTVVRDGNNLTLKKTGEVDVVEQIQSHHDGVSLAKMIERFRRGDSSALSHGSGFYADVTGYETDPAQVINNTRATVDAVAQAQKVSKNGNEDVTSAGDQGAAAVDDNSKDGKESVEDA